LSSVLTSGDDGVSRGATSSHRTENYLLPRDRFGMHFRVVADLVRLIRRFIHIAPDIPARKLATERRDAA
jgi:hypothetical protein